MTFVSNNFCFERPCDRGLMTRNTRTDRGGVVFHLTRVHSRAALSPPRDSYSRLSFPGTPELEKFSLPPNSLYFYPLRAYAAKELVSTRLAWLDSNMDVSRLLRNCGHVHINKSERFFWFLFVKISDNISYYIHINFVLKYSSRDLGVSEKRNTSP